jgi:hypothetical protein
MLQLFGLRAEQLRGVSADKGFDMSPLLQHSLVLHYVFASPVAARAPILKAQGCLRTTDKGVSMNL